MPAKPDNVILCATTLGGVAAWFWRRRARLMQHKGRADSLARMPHACL